MVPAVHVDRLPPLEPSVCQTAAGTSPVPSVQVAEADTRVRQEHLEASVFDRA